MSRAKPRKNDKIGMATLSLAPARMRFAVWRSQPASVPGGCRPKMHRFPSSSVIRRIRLVALLVVFKCVVTPAAGLLIIYAVGTGERDLVLGGIGLAGLAAMTAVAQWIFAGRTQCPLCMTPLLASKHCAKHRHARRFFGSYRLRVALAVLFTNSCRCPYCNEPSVLEVRRRGAPR